MQKKPPKPTPNEQVSGVLEKRAVYSDYHHVSASCIVLSSHPRYVSVLRCSSAVSYLERISFLPRSIPAMKNAEDEEMCIRTPNKCLNG
ncbi:hypothetical protein ABKN59_002331 [Abortiporus biennis]